MAKRPTTAKSWLIELLWKQPLWAIPFALFFGTLFGGARWSGYVGAYKVSLVFAYTIGLAVWATETFVMSRMRPEGQPRRIPLWAEIIGFTLVSILASMLAALLADVILGTHMLDNARAIVLTMMFAVLFALLVTGLVYAVFFYRQSIDRARADQELDMARRIQRSFLLSSFPERPRIEVHAVNWSSRQVSGDFYDVVPVGEHGILIAVADVSGKGVPAAILSSMLQASLRTQAGTVESVAEMMRKINTLVCQRAATGQFATFFLAWVDERSMRLRYTNAGHNFPVLLRNGGRQLLDQGGTVVGMMEGLDWAEADIQLSPGDRLLLYTDGVSEAVDASGEMYGEERLYQLLDALPASLPAAAMVSGVLDGLRGFLGEMEPGDDITVMALRFLDPPPAAGPAS